MHFDGADGSTTFTDSSGNALSNTAVGNAQIDTTQSVFGGASGLFDGSGDRVTCASIGNLFDFGTGDLTIEWRMRIVGTGRMNIFDITGYRSFIGLVYNNYFELYGPSGYVINTNTIPWNLNQWYSVAVVRAGNNWTVYKDGVSVATATNSNAFGGTGTYFVGSASDTSNSWNGWIDELRITKGVARYTSNYTPESSAFPDS
jgi:hypothetical protein